MFERTNSLKHDLNWTRGNDDLGSTVEHRPVGKLVQQSLGEIQVGSSKPTEFSKPIEDRKGKPVEGSSHTVQEVLCWSRRQILFFIQLLSSFQSFDFYNTMGWKCSLKNNRVRFYLIEHLSFLDHKINIVSSMLCACIARNVVQRIQHLPGLGDFHFLDQQVLSSYQILTSRYQSIADNGVQIECASHMVNVREYARSNQYVIL